MDFDTGALQAAIAEQLHTFDGCMNVSGSRKLMDCTSKDFYVTRSALFLEQLMPTLITEVVIPTRKDWAARIAYRIRAELVCCDIHEQMERALSTAEFPPHTTPRQVAKTMGLSYHAICRYGGWAAALAQEEEVADRGDRDEV